MEKTKNALLAEKFAPFAVAFKGKRRKEEMENSSRFLEECLSLLRASADVFALERFWGKLELSVEFANIAFTGRYIERAVSGCVYERKMQFNYPWCDHKTFAHEYGHALDALVRLCGTAREKELRGRVIEAVVSASRFLSEDLEGADAREQKSFLDPEEIFARAFGNFIVRNCAFSPLDERGRRVECRFFACGREVSRAMELEYAPEDVSLFAPCFEELLASLQARAPKE